MLNGYYAKMIAKMKADGFALDRIDALENKIAEVNKIYSYLVLDYKMSKK
ncbi:MAG: hypothetical protein IKB67_00280 [Clostridia bacterium]|nr:hypothetical protein [Clostridia bacterium]MBR2871637.1 hypothetical protein [Clostridia bacterium]